MKTVISVNYWLRAVNTLLLVIFLVGSTSFQVKAAQTGDNYVFWVREIELSEIGVDGLTGIAYSPRADLIMAIHKDAGQEGRSVAMLDRTEYLHESAQLESQPSDPLNVAFNAKANALYVFDPNNQELSLIPAESNGVLPPNAVVTARTKLNQLGIQLARGLDFDPTSGRMFLLDPAGKRLVIVDPDESGNYENLGQSRRLSRIDLKSLGGKHLRGLAFNPNSENLFTIDEDSLTLYEITQTGDLVSSRDISSFYIKEPGGMFFAPSGDATDDPQVQDLYLADTARNMIVEVSITPISAQALPAPSPVSLVNTIVTSSWSPPSPDPAGIDYFPATNHLIVSDSEVDEMSIFQGKNIFITTLSGNLSSTCVTTAFSKEPTGTAVNPQNNHIFFSDDGKDRVFEVNLGADGQYCTGDDTVTSVSTPTYGVSDPEGVGYGNGKLLIADGLNAEVYVVSPGSNGRFDGASPDGDDTSTHFDTAVNGLRDPEGIGYNPANGSIMVVSRADNLLLETSFSGSVLRVFDFSFLNTQSPAGVGVGPSSTSSSALSVYIAARGVDNNANPNENDGRVYELNVGDTTTPTPPPDITPTPTSTPSITPTPTATTTPPPPGTFQLYLSLSTRGPGSLSFAYDEDVIYFDGSTFSLFFDGSDVGLSSADVDAFEVIDSSTILLSFDAAVTIPNLGTVDAYDIVQFAATSLGSTTAGVFSRYVDGEDVGLTTSGENIDAIDLLSDGRVLISTSGGVSVPGASGVDEDILAFTPTSLGDATSGSWSVYFDGSDVDLATDSGEDVDGLSVTSGGDLLLSTRGAFAVSGVSGTAVDIFRCTPTSLGATTACSYSPSLVFTGSAWGITGTNLDAIGIASE
ncbi:MAG TPA: hypothetical protein VHO48_11825 [Anaerolineaceae bacterium]|nr:hypothetical protein [Anaerolineaceae bacterium]